MMEQFMGMASQSNLTRSCLSGALNDSTCSYAECGIVPRNSLHIMRSVDDPSLPWTGVIFGLTISSVWYWCSDQVRLIIEIP